MRLLIPALNGQKKNVHHKKSASSTDSSNMCLLIWPSYDVGAEGGRQVLQV